MNNAHILISFDRNEDGWLIRDRGFEMLAHYAEFRPADEGYTVIYVDDTRPQEPVYHLRNVRHLSLYQHEMGFRWVQQLVELTVEGQLLVDGKVYGPK